VYPSAIADLRHYQASARWQQKEKKAERKAGNVQPRNQRIVVRPTDRFVCIYNSRRGEWSDGGMHEGWMSRSRVESLVSGWISRCNAIVGIFSAGSIESIVINKVNKPTLNIVASLRFSLFLFWGLSSKTTLRTLWWSDP
jgi:hypothetical protein